MALIRRKENDHLDPFKEFFDWDQPQFGLSLVPFAGRGTNFKEGWFPAIDVSEEKDHIMVKADLPGLKKEEISVSLDHNILTIRGERKAEAEKKEKNYHRIERSYGAFERSVELSSAVDESKATAKYKDGVLELVLPKTEQAKSKQIEIRGE